MLTGTVRHSAGHLTTVLIPQPGDRVKIQGLGTPLRVTRAEVTDHLLEIHGTYPRTIKRTGLQLQEPYAACLLANEFDIKGRFYIRRTGQPNDVVRGPQPSRTAWTGPITGSLQAGRERAAWESAGWTADVEPDTPEIRAEVRAWEKATKAARR